jgi:hypothetical protein
VCVFGYEREAKTFIIISFSRAKKQRSSDARQISHLSRRKITAASGGRRAVEKNKNDCARDDSRREECFARHISNGTMLNGADIKTNNRSRRNEGGDFRVTTGEAADGQSASADCICRRDESLVH